MPGTANQHADSAHTSHHISEKLLRIGGLSKYFDVEGIRSFPLLFSGLRYLIFYLELGELKCVPKIMHCVTVLLDNLLTLQI